jgi:hypothetical protein
MPAKLVFESRLISHLLRQEETVENESVISLQLELTEGPRIYASDDSVVNDSIWTMRIHRHIGAITSVLPPPSCMTYLPGARRAHCAIEVHQSPERYAETLEMFKGGHVSEISIVVDGFSENADYSKVWNTFDQEHIAIESICFEFPLPQNEA